MYATKWFSNNTSDNVRHSAVKSLYAEGFAVYYGGRHQKETSQNRLLLTPEKSITMKLYRSPTNNSDGIFSVSSFVRSPFGSRSVLVRSPFGSRSVLDRFSFDSRSVLDRFSFILRSFSVRRSKNDRRNIGESSENHRRIIGGKTEMCRNSNGKPRERRSEQKLFLTSLLFVRPIYNFGPSK